MTSAARAAEPLMIPVASVTVRPQIESLEIVLDALYRIDYLLESSTINSGAPIDVEYLRSLTWTVQERAKVLPAELAELPGRFVEPSDVEASNSYANAAGAAYSGLLQRIEASAWTLMGRKEVPTMRSSRPCRLWFRIRGCRLCASRHIDSSCLRVSPHPNHPV